MLDDYQIPAVAILSVLALAFAYLYVRLRNVRTLLWLLGIVCTLIYSVTFWRVTMSVNSSMPWPFHGSLAPSSQWMRIVYQMMLVVATAFFLGSLSPVSFRLGKWRILYVFPYIVPLIVNSVLCNPRQQYAHGLQIAIYVVLIGISVVVAIIWSYKNPVVPVWIAETVVFCAAALCYRSFLLGNVYWPLRIGISGNLLMTALLVLFTWRRASPGVLFAVTGLVIWAIPPFMGFDGVVANGWILSLTRAWILSKILVAIGLLVLTMEDEIEANAAAGRRERRIRTELQSYAQRQLTARSLGNFDEQADSICAMVAAQSRFRRVALVLRNHSGHFVTVGSAGLDTAAVSALDVVLDRLTAEALMENLPLCIPGSEVRSLDLHRWLLPGEDLEQMHLTRFTAVLIDSTDAEIEGVLLLADNRDPAHPLVPEELLPVQILAARIRSARALSLTIGKLIDIERSAGACQLSLRLSHQLHNPLTVILGYGALLEERMPTGLEHLAVQTILLEARNIRSTLDRLGHLSRHGSERYVEFSVEELMADAEQLHRPDFLRESIEFTLRAPTDLPKLYGNQHRIRQALMHVLQYAIEAVGRVRGEAQKSIELEAEQQGESLRLVVRHSGARLAHPERVFHALDSGFEADVIIGIGLSLSAEILREYGGSIAATNLTPRGVCITLDIPIRAASPRR